MIKWAVFPTGDGQWGCGFDTSISIYTSGIQETLSPGFNEKKKDALCSEGSLPSWHYNSPSVLQAE